MPDNFGSDPAPEYDGDITTLEQLKEQLARAHKCLNNIRSTELTCDLQIERIRNDCDILIKKIRDECDSTVQPDRTLLSEMLQDAHNFVEFKLKPMLDGKQFVLTGNNYEVRIENNVSTIVLIPFDKGYFYDFPQFKPKQNNLCECCK